MSRFLKTCVTLGGIDLGQQYGFALDPQSPSPFDAPAQATPGLDIPGAAGILLPGTLPIVPPRTITISGTILATSRTELLSIEQSLKSLVSDGLIEIIYSQQSDRAWYGILQSQAFTYPSYGSTNLVCRVQMTFLCPVPFAIATSFNEISFGSSFVDIPLGTAPSRGRDQWSALIEIVGAATTPILTYGNSAGDTVGTMSFTGYSPSAGDSINIDIGRRLVTRTVSGSRTNAFTYLAAGYLFPALDPADGSLGLTAYPKLKVSSGSGSIKLWKHYR